MRATMTMSAVTTGIRLVVVVAVTTAGLGSPARGAAPTLAELRLEVEVATRPVRLPADPAVRAKVIHHLVDLHDRLGRDPAVSATPEARGLRGRVAARLTRLGGRLGRDAAAGGAAAEARKLIDLIEATVRPEAWDVNGGAATIRYFDNGHGLVVAAPDEVHEDVERLLRQLR